MQAEYGPKQKKEVDGLVVPMPKYHPMKLKFNPMMYQTHFKRMFEGSQPQVGSISKMRKNRMIQ